MKYYLRKAKLSPRSICLIIFFAATLGWSRGQLSERFTISGYVKEAVSGESLNGVNIYFMDRKTGTITNNYGFYSLTVPASDSVELIISYVGFRTEKVRINLIGDVELNIELEPGLILDEITVSADRVERESESVKMSTIKVQTAQIREVPSLLGEKDVLKILQLMPGIQKGSEGSSGIYVRGGGPDQNLIILDDAIVYNANHLFGFFSLFNGNALKSVELTKGGFPARYGGRLSSVLEMNMKEGNKDEWHGEGGIGLISSNFTVEGPLKKNISSILLSGRRTYADLILRPVLKITGEENTGYYFYDLNAKVNYDFGRKNKLYLSGYFGKDKFYIRNKSEGYRENIGFLWGNSTGTLRWNHLFGNKLFSNTSMVFSNYSFGIYDKYRVVADNKDFRAEFYSGIRDFSFKHDIDFIPNPQHSLKAGLIVIFHRFNPHAYVELDVPNNMSNRDITYINSIESALYIEDSWQPVDVLKINAGFRVSNFISGKTFNLPEPRFSAAWRLRPDLAVKSSFASMSQYIHLLSNTGINLPTDLWVPTTERARPQNSKQVAAGIVKDFIKKNVSVSMEGYYKKMNNIIGYKEGASFLDIGEPSEVSDVKWEDNITTGQSWSYGIELFLQKKQGNLTGWFGYTLSWTKMQFDSLNFGKKFFARHDRRHDISIVAVYKLNNKINLSGTWVYGTGNAVTLPLSGYQAYYHKFKGLTDEELPAYEYYGLNNWFTASEFGPKNNFRMSPYHRLDLSIQFHKMKKWGERIWEISLYNAYCRFNPFYYYTEKKIIDKREYGVLKQVSLFPVIPSLTYSFKF